MRNNPEKITGMLRRPSAISKMGLILCEQRDLSEDVFGFVQRVTVSPDFIVEEATLADAFSTMIRVRCKNYVFLATLELGTPLVKDLPGKDAELYLPLCTLRGEAKAIDENSKELTVTLSGGEDGVQPVSAYFFHVKLLHALSRNPLLVFDHSRMFVFTPEWLSLAARSCPSPYTMAHIFFHEHAFFENGDITGTPIDKETLVVTQGLSQAGLRELEAAVEYSTPEERERADEIAFIMLDIAVQILLNGSDIGSPKALEPILIGHLHETLPENTSLCEYEKDGSEDGFGCLDDNGEILYPIYAAWYPSPDTGNAVLCAFPAGTTYDSYDCSELVPFCEIFNLWEQAGKPLVIENMSFIGDECDSYLYSSRASVSFDMMCRKLRAMTDSVQKNDNSITLSARVKVYAGTEEEFEKPFRLLYEEEITNELLGDNFRVRFFDEEFDGIDEAFEQPLREAVNFTMLAKELNLFENIEALDDDFEDLISPDSSEKYNSFNGNNNNLNSLEELSEEWEAERKDKIRDLFGDKFFTARDYQDSDRENRDEDCGYAKKYGKYSEYGEFGGYDDEDYDDYEDYEDETEFGAGDELWCKIFFENGRTMLIPETAASVNENIKAGVPVAFDTLENIAIVDWEIKICKAEPTKEKLSIVERTFGVDEAYLFV